MRLTNSKRNFEHSIPGVLAKNCEECNFEGKESCNCVAESIMKSEKS